MLEMHYARRAQRRSVELPVELMTRDWDEPVLHRMTDISPYGIWVKTSFPRAIGERIVVCFDAPHGQELTVFAEVTRRVPRRGRARESAWASSSSTSASAIASRSTAPSKTERPAVSESNRLIDAPDPGRRPSLSSQRQTQCPDFKQREGQGQPSLSTPRAGPARSFVWERDSNRPFAKRRLGMTVDQIIADPEFAADSFATQQTTVVPVLNPC